MDYLISRWLLIFYSNAFTMCPLSWYLVLICFILLILLPVFSKICITPSNAVVLKNILGLFPFASFISNYSSLQVLIFFPTATFSIILNLAVLAIMLLLSSSLFSVLRLTSILVTPSSFSLFFNVVLLNSVFHFFVFITSLTI